MSDGRTGDRVRFEDDERLDIPDTQAISELAETAVVRALGGVMGFGSGVLSIPTITYNSGVNAGIWDFDTGFTVWQASSGTSPTQAYDGRLLRYDPSKAWQSTLQIDLTAYSANDATVWVRRVEVSADLDARKRDTGSGETTFSLNTRTREAIEITATANLSTIPSAGSGDEWVPIAWISNYSTGGAATQITFINAWDGLDNDGSIRDSTVANVRTPITASISRDGGLVRLLYYMRLYMGLMIDSTSGTSWSTVPSRGLSQIDGVLDEYEALPSVLATCQATWGGSSWTVNAQKNVSASTGTHGDFQITLPSTIAGKTVTVHSAHFDTDDSDLAMIQVGVSGLSPTGTFYNGSGATANISTGKQVVITVFGTLT